MPDETTSNPAPVDIAIPQTAETPISTPPEAVIAPAPLDIPTDPILTPEPTPEPQTAQMGGNEPLAEPVQVETEPISAQPPAPEIPEAIIPAEPTKAEVTPVTEVETPSPTPTSEPVDTPAPAQVVAPVIAQTFTKSIRELFTKAQLAIQNRKRKKIDRVMTLFAKQTTITNNEVEKFLHVSDATATRYLSTLEKEGKIKQSGKTGKGVSYFKI